MSEKPRGFGPFRRHNRMPVEIERLLFFTDAVVAIAITLLVLPVVETVSAAKGEGVTNPGEWLSGHVGPLALFGVSFVLVIGFWSGHNRVFEHVQSYGGMLFPLNTVWLMAIVIMPIATGLLGFRETDAVAYWFYMGSMLVASLAMSAMQWLLAWHPEWMEPGHAVKPEQVALSLAMSVLYGLALVIALLVPGVGFMALCDMFLARPVQLLLKPVARGLLRRTPTGAATVQDGQAA